MLLAWHRWRLNKRRHKHHNGSSLVKASTKLLASLGGELAFNKLLASFGVDTGTFKARWVCSHLLEQHSFI
jgi:hypothetical protein